MTDAAAVILNVHGEVELPLQDAAAPVPVQEVKVELTSGVALIDTAVL